MDAVAEETAASDWDLSHHFLSFLYPAQILLNKQIELSATIRTSHTDVTPAQQ
jgi:hypothetical protein